MKNSSNLNISCKVVFSLNKWNKKVGSPSSFGRKRPFISLNSSASIGNLSSSERARARARANHAKNDAQKGCAVQLYGITLSITFTANPNGKKKPRDHEFPAIFHVSRFQREEACSRVHQPREYFFKVFGSFCYNYHPVLKPSDFLFIFLRKLTG